MLLVILPGLKCVKEFLKLARIYIPSRKWTETSATNICHR